MLTFFRPHVLNEILIILHKNVVALLNPYPNKPWFLAPLAVGQRAYVMARCASVRALTFSLLKLLTAF